MSTESTNQSPPLDSVPLHPMVLPLDRALTRWSVACASWSELAAGSAPLLQAYLAGWMCRCCGTSRPQHEGDFRDSFRRGWADAETEIIIAMRQNGRMRDGGQRQ